MTTTVTIPPKFGCHQHKHVSPRFQMPIVGLSNRTALLPHCLCPRPLLIARIETARRGLCSFTLEEHTSEFQLLMSKSYDIFSLQQTTPHNNRHTLPHMII